MRLVEKGKAPKPEDKAAIADIPVFPWDHAMKQLATGDYDVVGDPRDGRGPDMPTAQAPAPGVDPVDGPRPAAEGQQLTNMTAVEAPGTVSAGLPKAPAPVSAPQPAKAPVKP